MQNPLTNDVQYQAANYSTEFAPVDIVDLVPEIEKENQRQSDAFDKRIASQKANDQRRIDIASKPSALEELGKFSETLTKSLVDIQDKRNKAAMQRGLMKALSEGVSPEEQAQFDADEATLTEGKIEADKAAEDLEQRTGNTFLADRVRGLSGWEKYGYTKGLIQTGAASFPAFKAAAMAEASVVIDGKTVTYENARTAEEFAALEAQVSSKFLEQYAGANPALLNKYLFPTIRQTNANAAVKFAAEQQQLRQTELKEGRKNDLYLNIETKQPDVLSNFILNHPKGPGEGKRELAAILQAGLEDGSISGQYVLDALFEQEITYNDGSTSTIAGKDPGVFAGLRQAAEDAKAGRLDRDTRDLRDKEQATENKILSTITEIEGEISDADRTALIQIWRDAHRNSPLPDSLKNALNASSEIDKDEARIRLGAILDERGYLTEGDFEGYPKSLQREYTDSIRSVSAAAPNKDQKAEANTAITARLDDVFKIEDGNAVKTPEYRRQERLARDAYIVKYNQGLNKGLSEDEAHAAAIQSVDANIQAGTYKVQRENTGSQAMVDRRDKDLKVIRANPEAINTGSFLTDEELTEAAEYVRTGDGPPAYLQSLARGLGIPSYDLAISQLKQAGKLEDEPDRPQVEQDVDKLDPAVQDLLRRQSSLSRTTRAVSLADGDTKFFLDSVAAVESMSHGEYDAMNTGGSGMGVNNQAYGSANSCDVTGCLSSMTLGEVMTLQASGRVFAAGRYQFIPDTLKETAQQLGLSMDTPFDAATQDALAIGRLRWRLGQQNTLTGLRTEWQGLWQIPTNEAQQVLDAGREVVSVYNQPQNILPALRNA